MPQANPNHIPVLANNRVSGRIPANLGELEYPLIDVKGSVETLVALVEAYYLDQTDNAISWLAHRVEDYVDELYWQYSALLKAQRKPGTTQPGEPA